MFEPGLYKVVRVVDIRKEPRRVQWKVGWGRKATIATNQRGSYPVGREVNVIYVAPLDKTNMIWGQVSAPDGTGTALWIPLWDVNGPYVERVGEKQSDDTAAELKKLIAWAKTKGYDG